MLQAGDPSVHGGFSKATECQMKQERDLQDDMAMFLYRLESDFEDKRRRLEKMLNGFHPVVSRTDASIDTLLLCILLFSQRKQKIMDTLTSKNPKPR